MAKHPFFCPGTGCTVKLQSVSEWFHTTSTAMVDLASQSTVFNIVLESNLYDICWFPQLWCEEQFWGRLVGWCKLVGHEHDQEPLWPSVNCLCRKWYNYWCIKSRLADPDLIILGHLEIYSPEPQSSVVATLARCSLCTQPRLAQESFCTPSLDFSLSNFVCCRQLNLTRSSPRVYFLPKQKPFRFLVWGRWLLYDFCLPNLKNPN